MAKSKSLWNYFNGEPFMENPHLAIVGLNPKRSRKKGKKSMAARRRVRRSRKASPRRRARKAAPRRKARRNFPTAGLAFNPRRRRRAKANPRRHHRRARRNPALLGVSLPPIQMIAWGAGGFLAPPMVEGFVNKFLPAEITSSTIGRYAVKIAAVLGLTLLVKKILSNKEAFPVAMGGSMYIVVSAVNEFAPQLTQVGTNAYRGGMITQGASAYRGGMIATGVGQYTKGGVNGPLPGLARSLPGLAQPSKMMSPWNLNNTGMTNPVFADPRFTFGNSVGR